MPVVARRNFRFGPFELDTHTREIYKHGLKLKLQGHPIAILVMLLERPGELITREEIQQKLWPTENETFVDFEHGLNTAVRKLRQALGDEAETPQYIETLPRRGYRFVGSIAAEGFPQNPSTEPLGAVADAMLTGATSDFGNSTATAAAGSADANDPTVVDGGALRGRLSFRPILVLVLLPVLLGIAAWMLHFTWRRAEPLKVTGTKQLTFHGQVSYVGGVSANYRSIQTDGRRVYYTVAEQNPVRSISANGGEEAVIPTTFATPAILHISPDGSTLLVREIRANGREDTALWLVATNGEATRRLGDIEAQDAAFAPDGKTVAFAKGSGLYLTDLQGSRPAKLAEVPGHGYWLRWSPDGRRLRFSILDSERLRSTLWELGPDRNPHQLLKDWKSGTEVCCGIWSPDGKYFLFRSGGQYWYLPDSSVSVHPRADLLISMGNSTSAIAANPLENEIFTSVVIASSEVFEWDVKMNRPTVLISGLHPDLVEFSPDKQQIAYTKDADRGVELWLARSDGSNKRQIATSPVSVMMARYSPDGQKIAFMARQPDGPWKVYWVPLQGGEWRKIPEPPVNQADPNWSPDGQSILFGQPPEYGAEGGVPRKLYSYDIRAGKTTAVPGSEGLFSPRWSPDGRYIAAIAIDQRSMSLLDLATSKWSPLVGITANNPFWSPDSQWVYFSDNPDMVWRVRVSDFHLERVLQTPSPSNFTSCWANGFAPDGAVLLSCFDQRRNIFELDLK